MPQSRVVVQGSERAPIPASQPLADAVPDPAERLTITVMVRRRAPLLTEAAQALSREQLAERHGATADDLAVVQRFAQEHSLQAADPSLPMRTVQLTGTIPDMERAFGTTLRQVQVDGTVYRERTGPLTLPPDVAAVVNDPDPNAGGGVFGLDNRPAAQPHFRLAPHPIIGARTAQAFSPLDVARLYNFPPEPEPIRRLPWWNSGAASCRTT